MSSLSSLSSTEKCIESVAANVLAILQITCNERFRNECFSILNVESSEELADQVKHRMTELILSTEQATKTKRPRPPKSANNKEDGTKSKKRSRKPPVSKNNETAPDTPNLYK